MPKRYPRPGFLFSAPAKAIRSIVRMVNNPAPVFTIEAEARAGKQPKRSSARAIPYAMTPSYLSWFFEQEDDYFGAKIVSQPPQFAAQRRLLRPPARSVVIAGDFTAYSVLKQLSEADALEAIKEGIRSAIGSRLDSAKIWCGLLCIQHPGGGSHDPFPSEDFTKIGIQGPGMCLMPATSSAEANGSGSITVGGSENEYFWFFDVPVVDTSSWWGRECLFIWLKTGQYADVPNMFGQRFEQINVSAGSVTSIDHATVRFQNVIDGAKAALLATFGDSSDIFHRKKLVAVYNPFDADNADFGDFGLGNNSYTLAYRQVQKDYFEEEEAVLREVIEGAGGTVRVVTGEEPPNYGNVVSAIVSEIETFYSL